VGAVNYLNSKPLIEGLDRRASEVRLLLDLPSRLADSLAQGRLDVALVPSVEFLRTPGYVIVSDACIACRGPVLSVKLYFRTAPREVKRLALDEGSRTSAALARLLLVEMCRVKPALESLPIGANVADADADAVLVIGDRAIADDPGVFCEVWDLGDQWWRWTGLPFVFAMWVARADHTTPALDDLLSGARDAGVRQLNAIADREAAVLGIDPVVARHYLRDNLHFTLGECELRGLDRFRELCVAHGLVSTQPKRDLQYRTSLLTRSGP
jgi:chorismate dehydratase